MPAAVLVPWAPRGPRLWTVREVPEISFGLGTEIKNRLILLSSTSIVSLRVSLLYVRRTVGSVVGPWVCPQRQNEVIKSTIKLPGEKGRFLM